MSIFTSPYETTSGKVFVTKTIHDAIVKALLLNTELKYHNMGIKPQGGISLVFITGSAGEELIPSFPHPLLVTDMQKNRYLAVDVRPFRRHGAPEWLNAVDFEKYASTKPDYVIAKVRAYLSLLWTDENKRKGVLSDFSFAGSVMAAWFSSSIARAYALNFSEQAKIMALSIYYYRLLFISGKKLDSEEMDAAVVHSIKTTKLPSSDLYNLFDGLGEIGGISDFCDAVVQVTGNVRLQSFNWLLFWNLIQNSWYGLNNKEILASAVEHPPTMIALVAGVMRDKAYKSSQLFKVIDGVSKGGYSSTFASNIGDLLSDHVFVAEELNDSSDRLLIPDFGD